MLGKDLQAGNDFEWLYSVFWTICSKKHGGKTIGPRCVNLRLFKALDRMIEITGGAVITLNWPVDENFEIRRDSQKDEYVRSFMKLFLDEYHIVGFNGINKSLLESKFYKQAIERRNEFIETSIRRKDDYEKPPNSVEILNRYSFLSRFQINLNYDEILVYKVGMTKIRSDPYLGWQCCTTICASKRK